MGGAVTNSEEKLHDTYASVCMAKGFSLENRHRMAAFICRLAALSDVVEMVGHASVIIDPRWLLAAGGGLAARAWAYRLGAASANCSRLLP